MIFSTKELYLKFKDYKTPHIKIQTEVKNKKLFPITRGLYEDNENTPGYLLTSYIKQDSYLSFEYVLSLEGLIPEKVFTYTAATTLKEHTSLIKTTFGNYYYQDIPVDVYMYGVKAINEFGYTYLIATKEKALCDFLYKRTPCKSYKKFKEMLFEDLRIDWDEFHNLDMSDLIFLCPLYKRKNLNFLKNYAEEILNEHNFESNVK